MNHTFFQLKSWITYWLDAVGAHSLHSPFYFDLYTNTILPRAVDPELKNIEGLRDKLLSDTATLHVLDLGAGSARLKGKTRIVRDIARVSLSPRKYSLLYKRIIQRYQCKTIIELGTSLGINTLYLASTGAPLIMTFEGSPAIARTAQTVFDAAGASNIKLILGNIDHTLPDNLRSVSSVDFALLDAHHRYQPTLDYFEALIPKTHSQTVIVIDDISYSKEMADAWSVIQQHDKVQGTIDLFRCGIVLFDPSLNKQHVVLQF